MDFESFKLASYDHRIGSLSVEDQTKPNQTLTFDSQMHVIGCSQIGWLAD